MSYVTTFKTGDKIIDFDQVFRIFKIKKEKVDNEMQTVMYFKPYFKSGKLNETICSMPVGSALNSNIRKPITKEKLKIYYKILSRKVKVKEYPDVNLSKEILKSNKPRKVIRLLRILWTEKRQKRENFSSSKSKVLEKALDKLSEEFAFVGKTTPKLAKEKIKFALQK